MIRARGEIPPRWSISVGLGALVVVLAVASPSYGVDNHKDDGGSIDFARDVEPVLARHCLKCHGPEKQRGGLRLDDRASVLAGGDSGEPAVKPGDVTASHLLERVTTADKSQRMPPRGEPLSADEITLLKRWVVLDAPWKKTNATAPPARPRNELGVTDTDREHWAFRPLRAVESPGPRRIDRARTTLDRFLLVRLEPKGLTFSVEASRRVLIRRLTFDLTGLPPSPDEVQAFVTDDSADAYEHLVDRLLASPRYGERWGRHWLDLARYADSDGYENDLDRKVAYRYRDFVIRAMNDDVPFDQFVRWQIAGDEYEPDNASAVAATGYCTAAPSQETTPADTEENKLKIRYDELDNIVSTVGSGLLGLTLGCARCHDHKFDPIPTRDYYRMVAAFQTAERREVPLSLAHRNRDRWLAEQRRRYREDKMNKLGLSDDEKFWLRQPEHFFVPVQIELYKKHGKALDPNPQQLRAWLSETGRSTLDWLDGAARAAEAAGVDPKTTALALLDRGARPEPAYVLARGSVTSRKDSITAGFLQVLTRDVTPEAYLARARTAAAPREAIEPDSPPGTTYQRRALAEWLTDPEHGAGGLLARVAVNRLWQHHFGEGLVRTPDDFGTKGEQPDHPELLEWLAGELVREGWRLKPIHRLIVTSAAYRQGTMGGAAGAAVDPENRLLWHRRPQRLEVEPLRDAMLAVSGRLNLTMYGPPFRPHIPAEAIATRSKDAYPSDVREGPSLWRRSVYAFVKRSVPNPLAEVFDAPDSTSTCGRRNTTAVPTQSLALLNNNFVRGCAHDLAQRVSEEAGPKPTDRIARAYALVLGRPPCDAERDAALTFIADSGTLDSLTDFCHVLLTLNEFLYVD